MHNAHCRVVISTQSFRQDVWAVHPLCCEACTWPNGLGDGSPSVSGHSRGVKVCWSSGKCTHCDELILVAPDAKGMAAPCVQGGVEVGWLSEQGVHCDVSL